MKGYFGQGGREGLTEEMPFVQGFGGKETIVSLSGRTSFHTEKTVG